MLNLPFCYRLHCRPPTAWGRRALFLIYNQQVYLPQVGVWEANSFFERDVKNTGKCVG